MARLRDMVSERSVRVLWTQRKNDAINPMQSAERAGPFINSGAGFCINSGTSDNSSGHVCKTANWVQSNFRQYKKVVSEVSARTDGKNAKVYTIDANAPVSGKKPADMLLH